MVLIVFQNLIEKFSSVNSLELNTCKSGILKISNITYGVGGDKLVLPSPQCVNFLISGLFVWSFLFIPCHGRLADNNFLQLLFGN
jgi:hypothetical protein